MVAFLGVNPISFFGNSKGDRLGESPVMPGLKWIEIQELLWTQGDTLK
jgi:hypothetical protein